MNAGRMRSTSTTLARRLKEDRPAQARCKACRKRRKVDRVTSRCSECTALDLVFKDETYSSTASSSSPEEIKDAIPRISHKSVERTQLLYTFLASYFPSDAEPEVWLARHMSPLLVLPDLDLSSPMMSSAVDTLCLAHLGSNKHDQRLLQASQNAYGKVLHSMVQAMRGRRDQCFSPREVIASCLLMSVYNDGCPANSDKWQNYATHLFGATQYAEAVGPSTLDPTQPFDQRLLMWLRFQSLFVSVAKRKRFFWSRPEWRRLESRFSPGGSRDWYPLLVPLPGLLEKADALLAPTTDLQSEVLSLYSLCAQLDKFREDLLTWVETDFAGQPGIAGVTDPEAFDLEIEEHCFITTSSTFTTFHVFKDPAHAMRSAVSWFMIVVADCTLLRLLQACPDAESAICRSRRDVERKAFNAASDICKSVYYYSVLHSAAYSHLICVWIDLAQAFFQEYGAVKEAGWCQASLIATNMRLRRLSTSSEARKTLCRIGDLFGAFNEPCRYKTRPRWPDRATVLSAG